MREKTKPTTYTATTPFTVYLEDVEALWAGVAGVSTEVQGETDRYADIASLEELKNAGGPVRELTIEGTDKGEPQMRIRLSRQPATVWIARSDQKLVGAMEQAKVVMWRHTRTSYTVFLGGGLILAVVSALVAWFGRGGAQPAGWAGLAVGTTLMVIGYRLPGARILMTRAEDERPWFGDRATLLGSLALIVAILGLLGAVFAPEIRTALGLTP